MQQIYCFAILLNCTSAWVFPCKFAAYFPKNTSGRLLLVFGASRSSSGPTLNDCLYSGPNNIEKIVDILIRFRLNYIDILGDIQQAFLNIEISTQHIDFLRFFWYDFHNTDVVEEIVWSRFQEWFLD